MSFYLKDAKICINCEYIFGQDYKVCPVCSSKQIYPLSKWIHTEESINKEWNSSTKVYPII